MDDGLPRTREEAKGKGRYYKRRREKPKKVSSSHSDLADISLKNLFNIQVFQKCLRFIPPSRYISAVHHPQAHYVKSIEHLLFQEVCCLNFNFSIVKFLVLCPRIFFKSCQAYFQLSICFSNFPLSSTHSTRSGDETLTMRITICSVVGSGSLSRSLSQTYCYLPSS